MRVDVLSAALCDVFPDDVRPGRSAEAKGGTLDVSLLSSRPMTVCCVFAEVEWLRGRVGFLLESLESGEVPCAWFFAQERMRSRNDSELGEVFFIGVVSDTRDGWCPRKKVVGGGGGVKS